MRRKNDSYFTPEYTINSLLNFLSIPHETSFLEPCFGNGSIYNKINCQKKYFAEVASGIDYLQKDFIDIDLIITNPPFSLAQEFLEKSLSEAKTVCYLLRLNFLESQKRYTWWQDKTPDKLLVLSKRPSFTGKGTDSQAYAWFVWDKLGVCKLDKGIHVI